MTQEGMMMGTVNYMSPEQVTGRGVDHRTDIFAAGAVLYEAISLEQAFPGRIDTGVLHRILTEGPVPLNQLVPSVDAELLAIVRRAMDRDPAQRYQDAAMMRRDILRVRRRLMDQSGGRLVDSGAVTAIPAPSTGRRPDSDRPRRLNPERFAELQRQQVAEHLRYGEEAFARGDHDAALHHAERAATVDPDSRDAFDLIDRARFASEAKAVRQLLGQAQRLLGEGQLEEAAALAEEASVTLPDVHGAAELRAEVRQVVENVTAARDREQRIVTSLERARASIERGGYETALRAVYEVLSIDPDRTEARTLEQRAQAGLQAQREHERARRGAHEQIARARALADEGRFEEAIQAIESVAPPSDTVRVAVKDAQAFVRAAQRQAAVVAIVAKARDAVDRGQFAEALAAIDSIPADERTRDMKALRDGADRALREQRELERKRAALESAIAAIHELIDRGELGPAQERLTAAWTIGISDERLPTLGSRLRHLTAEAEARRQQQVRDRLAAKRVEAARELLTHGDGYAAVTLLERDGSGHPLVAEALKEIRAAIAEQEERVRQEAERRRHEEEAQRRAEAEAARKLEEQRKAEEQRRRLDDERARREADRHRHREEVATLLIDAERALAAARHDEATVLLNRADERVESAEDTELRRRVAEVRASAEQLARQQLEENRRRQEEARQRERAIADLLERAHTTAAHEAALTILNEALTLAPTDTRVQQGVRERRDALEQQRAEEARAREEARRRAEMEAARAREEERRAVEAARLAKEEELRQETRRREEEARRREQEARQLEEDARRRAAEAARAREEAARLEREREAQRERDAQAAAVVEEAQTLFRTGRHEEALTVLRTSPIHALTQTAVKELEAQQAAIERQREREARRRRQQERRAATIGAIGAAVRDRRLHAAGAALAVVILLWAGWQYWPSSTPQVATDTPPLDAPEGSSSLPARSGDSGNTPPPPATQPPPATPTPRATAPGPAGPRGTSSAPPQTVGRITPPTNQSPPAATTVPPAIATTSPGGTTPQTAPALPAPTTVDQPAAAPQPQPQQPRLVPPADTTTPSAEPRVDVAADRAAILQLISRYADAYGRLDEAELRRIDPGFTGIPSRVLLKSLELTPSAIVVDVDPNGQTAKVRFTQTFRYEWNRPRMPPTQSGQVAWNLRKVAGVWVVVR
jgi:tetratricopeptide (TPR) repeat protein